MALNIVVPVHHFYPYPFILLSLIFCIQPTYKAPLIMMAQNWQSQREGILGDNDYPTNVGAEYEIEALQMH